MSVTMLARATAAVLVAPFLTLASALAPAHVHERGPGHDHAVAHSHFAPHHLDVQSDGIEIEKDSNDHAHVIYLDSPILHESPYQAAGALTALPASVETVRLQPRWFVTEFKDSAPVIGLRVGLRTSSAWPNAWRALAPFRSAL